MSKLTDLLTRPSLSLKTNGYSDNGRKRTRTHRKQDYTVLNEWNHRNNYTQHVSYRPHLYVTYLPVARTDGYQFVMRIPTKMLNRENTVRLNQRLFPRKGHTAEYFIGLMHQLGDELGYETYCGHLED